MTPRNPQPPTRDPRPAQPSRLRAAVAAPLRRAGRWFAHQPRGVRVGLVVVLLAGVAVGGYYARSVWLNRDTADQLAAAWGEFQEARDKTDLDAMRAALDRVLAANPGDTGAAHYRAMLDRGAADADAPDLALVLLRDHLRAGRVPEAAREADVVLARYPNHWQARCTLALHALAVRNDPAAAERILDQLPDPEATDARVTLGEVLYALSLFDAVGRDSAALRRLIVRRVAPLTRSAAAANAPPAHKAQLLECYLAPFADRDALGELAPFWAQADRLAEDAVNEADAAGDLAALAALARLGPRMRGALIALRVHTPDRVPDDRFRPLLKAVEDRTRRAWRAVREKTPDRPEPYIGLAHLALLENDTAAAMGHLVDGLAACGDRPELLTHLLAVAEQTRDPDSARPLAQSLWDSAAAAGTDAVKWRLAAAAMVVAGRADLALDACAKARAAQPGHPWTCATESRLWVRAGDFLKAREALAPLGDAVHVVPDLVRLNARVLVGSGLWVTRDDEFQKVLDAQAKLKPKTSAPAVAFLLGVLDAPADAERSAWVAAKAEMVLAADPAAPAAARARAEALYRLAELSAAHHPKGGGRPPVWNGDRVTAALRTFDQLPLAERVDADVIAAVATLRLKGEGEAAAALRAIDPLLPHEAALGPAHLEALGAVLTANDRPADAIRVLSRAAKMPKVSAGCRVALALAYHKNRQPDHARVELALAENTPGRSDREQAELVAAKLLLQQEKP